LSTNGLELYYRKGYALMFEDLESSMVHDLHIDGKSDKEILTIINKTKNTEETTNEVY
jgi:flagellar assembly factor FliW